MTEVAERETPYSVSRGLVVTDDFVLTHAEWHPSNPWGMDRGQPETGVRRKRDGEVVAGSFELIQHGWWNFDRAGDLILKALRKGWDTYRIATLMDWLKERNPAACFSTPVAHDEDGARK